MLAGVLGAAPLASAAPSVSITPKDVEVAEADGNAVFTLRLSETSNTSVTVKYSAREGNASNSATPGDDFKPVEGSVTIPGGDRTARLSVPVLTDSIDEGKERFQVYLHNPENASIGTRVGHVDILDSSSSTPEVSVSPKSIEVDESAGNARMQVVLSGSTSNDVSVVYEAREGNADNAATAGEDFKAVRRSVTIPAGETNANITVPVISDSADEDRERFQVFLLQPENANIGTRVGHVDIVENGAVTDSPELSDATGSDSLKASSGKYAYLDDVDRRVAMNVSTGNKRLANLDWPRIGLADSPIGQSIEQLSKYQLIAAQNLNKIGKVQNLNPKVFYLRQVNPVEFQFTIKKAMPFTGTGPKTDNGNVYAGHWAYRPGTRLRASIGQGATTLRVDDASRIQGGSYVVVYDGSPGSFRNAEHVFVRSVNRSNNTLTIGERGYKSAARSHDNGAIVAQHVTGGGLKANARNWVYNQSTACPKDGNGNTFGQAMVKWLARYYNRNNNGNLVDVRVDGFQFDTDRYIMLNRKDADVDNNLKVDDGFKPSGYNMWGEGLANFYAQLRRKMPDMVLVGGGSGSRGWKSLNGIQWEGFPVANGSFSTNPDYEDAGAQLSNYGLHVRNHDVGPSLTHALNKSPTKLYPNLEPSHRSGSGGNPTSNAPFRFSFGMALLDDGFYGQPSSGAYDDVWWDEYAVDVEAGSPTFGHAIASRKTDESRIRVNLGWMGQPLGGRVRVYDATRFAPDRSLIRNGGIEGGLGDWTGRNLKISKASDSLEGSSSLRASEPFSYADRPVDAQVLGPKVHLERGKEYTLAFAVKAGTPRQINVAVGGSTSQTLLVPNRWVRRVVTFKAGKTGSQRLKFQLGLEQTPVWIDAIYLFEGNANLFQRDFENARIVVNDTGSRRTVDLGGTFMRIQGTGQDPVNDGSRVKQVTVPSHDAAFLVRMK